MWEIGEKCGESTMTWERGEKVGKQQRRCGRWVGSVGKVMMWERGENVWETGEKVCRNR